MALVVVFVNNGEGPDDAACYDVEVRVNHRAIYLGSVSGHNRRDHWTVLLQLLLDIATKPDAVDPQASDHAKLPTRGSISDPSSPPPAEAKGE